MAFLSVTLGTEQIINGIAIVLLAQGITAFIFEELFAGRSSRPSPGSPDLEVPLLSEIPGVGQVLFEQNALFYVSVVLALGVSLLLMRTRFGLSVRAVGENPAAADAAAVPGGAQAGASSSAAGWPGWAGRFSCSASSTCSTRT